MGVVGAMNCRGRQRLWRRGLELLNHRRGVGTSPLDAADGVHTKDGEVKVSTSTLAMAVSFVMAATALTRRCFG